MIHIIVLQAMKCLISYFPHAMDRLWSALLDLTDQDQWPDPSLNTIQIWIVAGIRPKMSQLVWHYSLEQHLIGKPVTDEFKSLKVSCSEVVVVR